MPNYKVISLTKSQKGYLENLVQQDQPKNIEDEKDRIAILVKLEGRKKANARNLSN